MIKWLILFMFFSTTAWAGISVCPETDGPVTSKQLSGNPQTGCLYFSIPPNTVAEFDTLKSLIRTVPMKYLKVVSSAVQEMTLTEKDAIELARKTVIDNAFSQRIDNLEVPLVELARAICQLDPDFTCQQLKDKIKQNLGL